LKPTQMLALYNIFDVHLLTYVSEMSIDITWESGLLKLLVVKGILMWRWLI